MSEKTIEAIEAVRDAFWHDYNAPEKGDEAVLARKALDLAVAELVVTWEDDPLYAARGVESASRLIAHSTEDPS